MSISILTCSNSINKALLQTNSILCARIEISVNSNISVVGFYENIRNIGNIGKISVNTAPAAAQGSPVMGSASAVAASHPLGAAALAPRRYHTQVGPTPPSPPHPRPSRRAPLSKRAQTSGPGESSSSRHQKPQSPPHQGPVGAPPLDLSLASIIRRPYFHYSPIPRNTDCSARDVHDEIHYDLTAFAEDPEL